MIRALVLLICGGVGFGQTAGVEGLYAGFRKPPAAASISPYWFWNGKVTAAETRRQIGEMARQGVRGATVMSWAGLEPAYLSEAYWEQVGVALEAARAAGVRLNFADEYLWPSGQAWDYASLRAEPSRVLQRHPEFRMQRLSATEGSGAALVRVAGRVGAGGAVEEETLKLVGDGWAEPGWKVYEYRLTPALERGTRVDLLNPAAVRVFLDLVYEEYAKRFPSYFGSTIEFFVSDHEGIHGVPLPYTPALFAEFEKRHGYDLRPWLPVVDGTSARARRVRMDYLETVGWLYARSFTGQVTEWCRRHGVRHGHSDIEENLRLQVGLAGDMFALWRASSAVYVDALVDRCRMPLDFMEARSVAHFEGTPLMVENQGLAGNDSYWSLEKGRLGTNMCLLWGANRLIGHYFEYDPEHLQYPPSFFLTQPLWRHFHLYAEAAQRGLYMNGEGRHEARVAVYHPRESAYAGSESLMKEGRRDLMKWGNEMDATQTFYAGLQLELARGGWDYHMLDAHYLENAEVKGAELRVGGEGFRVLILPPMAEMEKGAAEQVRRFAAAGGVVLAVGAQPAALDGVKLRRFAAGRHAPFMERLDYTEHIVAPEGVRRDLEPVLKALGETVGPEVEMVEGTREGLYFARREKEGVEWWWAVNDTGAARRATVRFDGGGTFEKWDAVTGERFALRAEGGVVALEFGPWDGFYVVRHPGESAAPQVVVETARRVVVELQREGWRFAPDSAVRVPYARVEGESEPVWLAPERLANRKWWLNGPYPYAGHESFFEAFPPEQGFAEGDAAWKWFEAPSYVVQPPGAKGIYYAAVNVWSPVARKARAAVVAYDGVKLWWNGEAVLTAFGHPPFVHMRDSWAQRPEVTVRQGWNTVLMKIAPAQAGATGFLFRMTDDGGNTLRDVVYARERKLPERTQRRVRLRVEAPMGTAGPGFDREMEESEMPERPVVFEPRASVVALGSWTDQGLAHYAGTAVYEKAFEVGERAPGERLVLDLGAVGLAAEVWVNGRRAGERAWRPYELEITDFVKRGRNELKIRVANSNAGWMAQGDAVYRYGNWGVKFRTERDRLGTLHPNGLEGPVRVLGVK